MDLELQEAGRNNRGQTVLIHRSLRRVAALLAFVSATTILSVARVPDMTSGVPDVRDWAVRLTGPGRVRADAPFALVGVTWPRGSTAPRDLSVRTSPDGHRWSGWQELELEPNEGPDSEGGVRATKPVWAGVARFVDVRSEGPIPRGAEVRFVDPGADPKVPSGVASASVSRPGIISRAQWGADERIRRRNPDYAEPLKAVIIHHTATGNSYSRADSARIVRSIYAYHVKSNGWDDIGYNILVDRYGQIFEGRYGGMTRTPVGAHAKGFNRHTSGIAIIGSFERSSPPDAAKAALRRVAAWKLDGAFVDPAGTTVYTSGGSNRYAEGQRVRLRNISGHRDVGKTTCPGGPLYDWLPTLRQVTVRYGGPKLFGKPRLSATKITPNGDGVADTTTLTARLSQYIRWRAEVLDRAGKVVWSTTAEGTNVKAKWSGKNGAGEAVPHDRYRFRLSGRNENGTLKPVEFSVSVWGLLDGTALRTPSGWTGVLERQRLRRFLTREAVYSRYAPREILPVPEYVRDLYRAGAVIGFRDGSVARADGDLWVISAGRRRPTSQMTLDILGFDRDGIIDTRSKYLSPHPPGPEFGPTDRYPEGVALRALDGKEARVAGSGPKRITSIVRRSHAIRDVDLVGPADLQMLATADGPALGFRDGTLIKSRSSNVVFIIEHGYRRPIASEHRFSSLGYKRSNVLTVTNEELALHRVGKPV